MTIFGSTVKSTINSTTRTFDETIRLSGYSVGISNGSTWLMCTERWVSDAGAARRPCKIKRQDQTRNRKQLSKKVAPKNPSIYLSIEQSIDRLVTHKAVECIDEVRKRRPSWKEIPKITLYENSTNFAQHWNTAAEKTTEQKQKRHQVFLVWRREQSSNLSKHLHKIDKCNSWKRKTPPHQTHAFKFIENTCEQPLTSFIINLIKITARKSSQIVVTTFGKLQDKPAERTNQSINQSIDLSIAQKRSRIDKSCQLLQHKATKNQTITARTTTKSSELFILNTNEKFKSDSEL